MKQNNDELENKVIRIQRFWRCYLTKKYNYGRKLLARKCAKDRLYDCVIRQKYHGL